MSKRWTSPTAKPGEIKIAFGRPSRHDDPDLCVAWGGGGADKSDARYALHALTEKRYGYAFPSMTLEQQPSVIEELEARGYDITTLRFSIQRKPAKAIEARRAETGTGSVHESAVPHGGIRPDDGATPLRETVG